MKVLFVSKQSRKEELTTEEIIGTFEDEDDLKKIGKAVEHATERIYLTWASVQIKDKAGEIIPIADIINEQKTLLERNGPVTDEHSNRVVGQTLAFKVMEHPKSKTLGVLHLNKIYDHNDVDDTVWKEITTGVRTGSSVGGYNTGSSFARDEVTNEKAKVLEGFRQFETASVREPCNPLALNEAFSVVAKSDRASNSDKEDDEEDKEYKKKDNLINIESKDSSILNKQTKGETTMTEDEISKKLDAILKSQEDISKRVKSLEKQDEEETPPKEEEMEEKKKIKKEDEEEEPEEIKPEEKKKIKKEDAASDIEGETPAEPIESPEPDQSNDEDVTKRLAQTNKELAELKKTVQKSISAPRPGGPGTAYVNKVAKMNTFAKDIALQKVRPTWREVHKTLSDINNSEVI